MRFAQCRCGLNLGLVSIWCTTPLIHRTVHNNARDLGSYLVVIVDKRGHMGSFLNFTHPKPFWKRSTKMKESSYVDADRPISVTVAVVGCGQRGKVSVSISLCRLVWI